MQGAVIGEMVDKQVDEYFEAGKSAEAPRKMMLQNGGLLAPIVPFVQAESMGALASQRKIIILRTTSTENHYAKISAVEAEAKILARSSYS